MSIGLIALLDDVAALANVAAASLDDVASQAAKRGREGGGRRHRRYRGHAALCGRLLVQARLPIVAKIARGSSATSS